MGKDRGKKGTLPKIYIYHIKDWPELLLFALGGCVHAQFLHQCGGITLFGAKCTPRSQDYGCSLCFLKGRMLAPCWVLTRGWKIMKERVCFGGLRVWWEGSGWAHIFLTCQTGPQPRCWNMVWNEDLAPWTASGWPMGTCVDICDGSLQIHFHTTQTPTRKESDWIRWSQNCRHIFLVKKWLALLWRHGDPIVWTGSFQYTLVQLSSAEFTLLKVIPAQWVLADTMAPCFEVLKRLYSFFSQ